MKLLFPLLLVGISVASFLLYIDPQFKEVTVLKSKIAQYDAALETSEVVKKQKEELASKDKEILLRNGGEDEKKLNKILPNRIESIKFILDTNYLAVQNRISIKNVTIGAGDGPKGGAGPATEKVGKAKLAAKSQAYKSTPFGFSVSTSYEGFLSFLRNLEKNLQIMDITSISFKSSDNNYYDFTISGVVYSVQ